MNDEKKLQDSAPAEGVELHGNVVAPVAFMPRIPPHSEAYAQRIAREEELGVTTEVKPPPKPEDYHHISSNFSKILKAAKRLYTKDVEERPADSYESNAKEQQRLKNKQYDEGDFTRGM